MLDACVVTKPLLLPREKAVMVQVAYPLRKREFGQEHMFGNEKDYVMEKEI